MRWFGNRIRWALRVIDVERGGGPRGNDGDGLRPAAANAAPLSATEAQRDSLKKALGELVLAANDVVLGRVNFSAEGVAVHRNKLLRLDAANDKARRLLAEDFHGPYMEAESEGPEDE